MSNIPKLIFDIETAGNDFEELDEFSQHHIKKYAVSDDELEEAKNRLGFSPLTGEIVAIGTLDSNTNKAIIYVRSGVNNDQKLPDKINDEAAIVTGTEAEIISHFWKDAERYNGFVSFNGRMFDVPFLMVRSAILGIRPSKNLVANRYLGLQPFNSKHIDLFDQFSFYGASRTRSSLHFWSKAFGTPSPKDQGTTGEDVKGLFNENKIFEIAKYNLGDLIATKVLYEKWEKYLNI